MDLWVLPPPNESKWFARIDWYLNWQMCKGLSLKRTHPHAELFRVLEDSDYEFEMAKETGALPLLVISRGRIPASKCLVLAKQPSLQAWLGEVHRQTENLQAQTLRVFLPRGSSGAEADRIWKDLSTKQAQFTSDEDAL